MWGQAVLRIRDVQKVTAEAVTDLKLPLFFNSQTNREHKVLINRSNMYKKGKTADAVTDLKVILCINSQRDKSHIVSL